MLENLGDLDTTLCRDTITLMLCLRELVVLFLLYIESTIEQFASVSSPLYLDFASVSPSSLLLPILVRVGRFEDQSPHIRWVVLSCSFSRYLALIEFTGKLYITDGRKIL